MHKKSIVVLISGSGSNLQAIIDACKCEAISGSVAAVISNKDGVYGLKRAEDANIPTHVLSHKNFDSRNNYDDALAAIIDTYQPDIVVLAGFMRILSANFVNQYQGKMLNIHPSLLPKYQGLDTHQRALDAGDTEHGVSVHFVTEELDGGPVILQAKVTVDKHDTAQSLADKVHLQEHIIYPKVIQWLCTEKLIMSEGSAIYNGNQLPPDGAKDTE